VVSSARSERRTSDVRVYVDATLSVEPSLDEIPTLRTWGLLLLVVTLAGLGVIRLR
jgi:hypothetical protein